MPVFLSGQYWKCEVVRTICNTSQLVGDLGFDLRFGVKDFRFCFFFGDLGLGFEGQDLRFGVWGFGIW